MSGFLALAGNAMKSVATGEAKKKLGDRLIDSVPRGRELYDKGRGLYDSMPKKGKSSDAALSAPTVTAGPTDPGQGARRMAPAFQRRPIEVPDLGQIFAEVLNGQ